MRLDWRREHYVWVPTGNQGTLQALGLEAQALVAYLARLADARGVIRCLSSDTQASLFRLCGTHIHERQMLALHLRKMHQTGTLAPHVEGVHLPEFVEWQRTREPRRRLYERESATIAQLPTFTRALFAHLVRVCDDEGQVHCSGPLDWATTAVRGHHRESREDRRMATRIAVHLDTLLGVGVLASTPQGLRVQHHAEAQRPAPRLDVAEAGPARVRHGSEAGPARVGHGSWSDATARNHSTAVGTPVPSLPSLPSDPPLNPPLAAETAPVVEAAAVLPIPPPRVSRPAAGRPSLQNDKQGTLLGILDPPPERPAPPAEAAKRRGKVKPPTVDVAPPKTPKPQNPKTPFQLKMSKKKPA
jgi:hypothetical protein